MQGGVQTNAFIECPQELEGFNLSQEQLHQVLEGFRTAQPKLVNQRASENLAASQQLARKRVVEPINSAFLTPKRQ